MEYIYLIFALLAYFPLTLSDKLGSEGTEEKAMLFKYSFYRSLIGIVFGVIMVVISGSKIQLDPYTVLTAALFGLSLALCMLVTFYSMQVTTVAISSVFKAASVIIPCVFGALFFEESITLVNVLGFVIFLISVYLIVSKSGEKKSGFGVKALLACLGVLFTNGLGSIAIQVFGNFVPNGEESVFMLIAYCIQSLILLVIHLFYAKSSKNSNPEIISKKMWIYAIIGTVAAFLIQQIMAGLSSEISALIIFPVTMGSSVVISVVVGWLWFKEKLTLKNISGIIGTIISLVMINMF